MHPCFVTKNNTSAPIVFLYMGYSNQLCKGIYYHYQV